MRTLIALLLTTTYAAAEMIDTCTGRVTIQTEKVGDGLLPKGTKVLEISNCAAFYTFPDAASGKRILRTCPIGSNCRVTASVINDDEIDAVLDVTRVK